MALTEHAMKRDPTDWELGRRSESEGAVSSVTCGPMIYSFTEKINAEAELNLFVTSG